MTDHRLPTLRRVHRPCDECPTRRDVPTGKFGPNRFEALSATAGRPGAEADLSAPIFACHKSPVGGERACAGWLVLCGRDHLRVRLALATGALPTTALTPGNDWPPLYDTYGEMAAANGATIQES